MIRFRKTEVSNFEGAIRGMRNPLESHKKSDSYLRDDGKFILGDNDLDLAMRLRNAGSDHRKYLRQIFVCVDIEAPLYWWKEFDTYKVGVISNSESTMHTIHKKSFTEHMFSWENCGDRYKIITLQMLEDLRLDYLKSKEEGNVNWDTWRALIQALPTSFNQTRTITMTYENLINMYHARKNHKLTEWHDFCSWIKTTVPYAKELIV